MKEILNSKIDQVKELFIDQIKIIQHHADSEREKINLHERLNKGGLKFAEMDTEKLIENIASIVELKRDQNAKLSKLDKTQMRKQDKQRPLQVWQMLQKNFGSDYFVDAIEEEYGIAPNASDVFAQEVKNHFCETGDRYERKFKEVKELYVQQVKQKDEEISGYNQGISSN